MDDPVRRLDADDRPARPLEALAMTGTGQALVEPALAEASGAPRRIEADAAPTTLRHRSRRASTKKLAA